MFKRKIIFFLTALFSISLVSVIFVTTVFSYATKTTHPALTDQMVDFYNASYPDQISGAEKEQMVRGSIDEDVAPRWLNHFYDPTTGDGWLGENLGNISPGLLRIFTKVFLNANTEILSSKKWAHAELLQTKYVDFGGNNTWENGVRAYAAGDTDKAYYILGHILHLLEDATVPDHTRNDTHVHEFSGVTQDGGSPYEDYADQFSRGNLKMVSGLVKSKKQPVVFDSLDAYFDNLANYSNGYFFSEHTVKSNKYVSPKILREDDKYGYGVDKNGVQFPLVRITKVLNDDLEFENLVSLKEESKNKVVLSSYFTRLSEAAVLDGAGVIKLFKQQGENAKKNPALLAPIPTIVPGNKMYSLGLGYVLPAVTWLQNGFNSLFATITPPAQTEDNSTLTVVPVVQAPEPVVAPVAPKPTPPAPKPPKPAPKPVAAPQSVLGLKIESPDSPLPIVPPPAPLIVQNPLLTNSGGTASSGKLNGNEIGDSVATTTDSVVSSTLPTASTTTSVVTEPVVEATTSTSSTVPVVVVPDTTAPTVPELQVVFVNDVVHPVLRSTVHSTDSESVRILYDISFSISTSTEKVWQVFATSSAVTVFDIPVTRGLKYFIRARATDASGNISEWSGAASLIIPHTQEVVINEVAWAGTSADTKNDQWIELYNTTDATFDLQGWQLIISGRPVDIVFKSSLIGPHQYYLLERSNDTVVRNIDADARYFFAAGFSGGGNTVDLIKNDGSLVDQIDASGGWFAGDATKYRTMERLRTDLSGNDPTNWQSNQGQRGIGRTNNGGDIQGSPRQSNFGFLMLAGRQDTVNRVLTKNNNPYILGFYEIPVGYTLTIEPGVVIKSAYNTSVIDVFGSFASEGSSVQPVVLTSGRDHSFGDASLDTQVGTSWSAPNPAAKDWQGIWLRPGSSGILNNTHVRYAGKEFRVDNYIFRGFISQAVRAENAMLSMRGNTFVANAGTNVYLYTSTSSIHSTLFDSGSAATANTNTAIEAESSALTVEQSSFQGFGSPTGPIWTKFTWPTYSNLTFADNAFNQLFLDRTFTGRDRTLDKKTPLLTNGITVDPGTTLTIDPGVTVNMPEYGFVDVKGSLQAVGTEADPIIFTTAPGAINWDRIFFDHATSTLRYVVMTKGNRQNTGVINANSSNVQVDRSSFLDSRLSGGRIFELKNTILTATNSVIGFSNKTTITGLVGIHAEGGEVRLDQVTLKNLTVGVQGASSPLPVLRMNGMNEDYFPGTGLPWSPAVWVGSDGNTVSVGDPDAGQVP